MHYRVSDPEPGWIQCFCLDFKFLWVRIRIRFSNFPGSGSGFQISLDPNPVSSPGSWRKKKSAERALKVICKKKTY